MTIRRPGHVQRALLVSASLVLLGACAKGAGDDDEETSLDGGRKDAGKDSGKDAGRGSSGGEASADDDVGDDDVRDDDGGSGGGDDAGGGTDAAPGDDASPPVDAGPPVCAPNQTTQTSFVSLAVPAGSPFNGFGDTPPKGANGAAPTITAPNDWKYYRIDGAKCRDGSEFGVFARITSSKELFIYLEGGGACDEPNFCDHNPANINQLFDGGGEKQGQTVIGSLGLVAGLQQPYTTGIFDETNSANPMKDWNWVYIPYCTGDVHFGTAENVTSIPDSFGGKTNYQFVGYRNVQKVVARAIATYKGMDHIILTGASAGGIGAALNLGLVQDSFTTSVPVDVLDDSGPPSDDKSLWPACLQKTWRQSWGFAGSLPSDCKECTNADGSGLNKIVDYWHHKYPKARVGLVSTMEDQVIRLFYGQGNNNCANLSANFQVFLGSGGASSADYTKNLNNVLSTYQCTGAVSSYFIGTSSHYPDDTLHQHIFRSEFFNALTTDGKTTLAQWTADFIGGKSTNVGP